MRKTLLLLFALFAVVVYCEDWTELMQFRKAEGNLVFGLAGRPGTPPLVLRVNGNGRVALICINDGGWEVTCNDAKGTQIALPQPMNYGGIEEASAYDMLIKFREEWWAYYVNGRLCGEMQAPMALEGCKLEWPNASQVQLSKQLDFQITARPDYQTDFMIEPGAKDELQPWKKEFGNWHIHTALLESIIRPETNQDTMKRTPPSADKSPNFYSLKGSGKREEALITTGSDLFDNYTLTASMQPQAGEAGIVFLCRGQGKDCEFYALTLYRDNGGEVRLWKQDKAGRKILARVELPLYNCQWYLPGVSLRNGEIIATLDKAPLFRYRAPLPSGGRIGLYASTPDETRFDDVTVSAYGDIAFESANDIASNTVYATEAMRQNTATPPQISLPHEPYALQLSATNQEEMLVLGRSHEKSVVFSTMVRGEKAGILAGWHGVGNPFYVFTRSRNDKMAHLELLRFAPGGKSTLDSFDIPWKDEVQLLMEIDAAGTLRCCCDDALIFKRGEVTSGAAGLYLPAGGSARFTGMEMSRRRVRTHELKQKNVVFEHDPFMRHWAAAEGQWIGGGGDILYHKGDFFGDFNMSLPYKVGGEIHFGLADGAKEGALKIVMTDKEVRMTGPDDFSENFVIEAPKADTCIAVSLEGYWLELSCGGKVLNTRRLALPLREYGTRLLTKKYTSKDMEKSKVTRMNVIDEFFNESPHDWLVNGGDWQIINRFQCTASWSHMIAQSLDTMGAFWRKQRFQGDMTLEFYAGTRHGYYDKAGNMNCTIMSKDNTASSGYTVTCSEWDQNKSQNWTYLYRNGERINKSDAYMVPRRRKGTYRRILNPLIARGRDIHGAWYYLKLRKIGNKLEFWFDDELVMTSNDDNVLNEGCLGIWTFDHSMTLAQIKITYEKATTKQHNVRLLPNDIPEKKEEPAPEHWDSTANGFPLNAMEMRYWEYKDGVAQGSQMSFASNTDGIMLVNKLGAGEMKLNAKLPDLKVANVAGFRFDVKRSETARFNFFYTIHKNDDKKTLLLRHFHKISGDDFSGAYWQKTGESEVKPTAKEALLDKDGWTTVTVWLPNWVRNTAAEDDKRVVRVGGFGLEQFDFLASGIGGNAPGDAYAIRDFRPIFFKRPDIVLGEGVRGNARHDLHAARPKMTTDTKELAAQLDKCAEGREYATAYVDLNKGRTALTAQVDWVQAGKPDVRLAWSQEALDTLELSYGKPYADYRMGALKLSVNGIALALEPVKNGKEGVFATARMPRTDKAAEAFAKGKLECEVRLDAENVHHVSLEAADKARRNGPPALMKVDGMVKMWLGFEGDDIQLPLIKQNRPRMTLLDSDAEAGRYVRISNVPGNGNLATDYALVHSVAEYPLFFFRYNADDMCNVSLIYPGNPIKLAWQSSNDSRGVRYAKPFEQDSKWHSWLGFVPDAFTNRPYQKSRYNVVNFRIASHGRPDQTGLYSNLKLDDITVAPAVNTAEKLAFTPHYFDLDGVDYVEYAVYQETDIYDGREVKQWKRCKPGEKITPELPGGIKDGIAHILLRAADKAGNVSPITDLPFLLDRAKPSISASIVNTSNPLYNGKALQINVGTSGGAPWNLDKAVFKSGKAEFKINSWSHEYERNSSRDVVFFNYSMIMRRMLDKAKDGDTLTFTVSNVSDGAGNSCDDLNFPIKINYAEDKRGPNWYSIDLTEKEGYCAGWNWEGHKSAARRFNPTGGGQEIRIDNTIGSSAHLVHHSHYGTAEIAANVKWELAKCPYIAFRLSTTTFRKTMKARLLLITEDNKTYMISLTKPAKEASELNTKQSFTWENGKWINYAFNVRQMLVDKGIKDVDKMRIKAVHFQRVGVVHRDTLLLDDFHIFGETAKLNARITAFDISGVASVDVYDGDALLKSYPVSDKDRYDFSEWRNEGIRWLRLVVKDKAGNMSVPTWLPIAPKETK
ncbi:MAG: hypothetical protein IJS08_07430 [Victivallales bacterium]|nr:hypothetical protein [Victivallales bacterium]